MLASQALEPDPAADPKLDIFRRIYAAEALGRLHDPRGPDALTRFMLDPDLRIDHVELARRLQRLGDPRGRAWLNAYAAATGLRHLSDDR
jgi:hypothetical protein